MIEEIENIWPYLDRLVQWIIIPLVIFVYQTSRMNEKRHTSHEKTFIRMEGENTRILSILEERQKQRDEDKELERQAIVRLTEATEKLNARLDTIIMNGK